jgi:hypothetical protein
MKKFSTIGIAVAILLQDSVCKIALMGNYKQLQPHGYEMDLTIQGSTVTALGLHLVIESGQD